MLRLKLRALTVGGLGGAGIFVGHSLGYLLIAPDAGHRTELLESSGHSYLPWTWPILLGVAAFSALVALASGFVREGRLLRPASTRLASIVSAALFQAGGFVLLEVGERLLAHGEHPLAAVLAAGLPLQLLVGAFAGFLSATLERAGARLARLWSRPGPRRATARIRRPGRSFAPPRIFVSDARRVRAPPLLA